MLSDHDWAMELLSGYDGRFMDVLRMNKDCFYRLCSILFVNGVEETRSISVQEKVMIFLIVVGHYDSNRRNMYEWCHSEETVSKHFNNVFA